MPWRPFVQAVREAKTVQQVAHPADRSTALCSAEPCSQLLKENWSPQIPFFSFMQFLLLFEHMRTIYSVQKVRYWRVFSNPARFDRVPAKYAVSRSERRARPHCSLEHNAMVYLLPALSSFRFSISPVAFGWRHCGTLTHTAGGFTQGKSSRRVNLSPNRTANPLLGYSKQSVNGVCSEIHTKHIRTLYGQNVEFLSVTDGGTYSNHWVLKGYEVACT